MVDGEGDRRRGRDVPRIGDLLEIGLQREGQREEQMVEHVERARHDHAPAEPVDPAIGEEHERQPDVFEGHRVPLAEPPDAPGP